MIAWLQQMVRSAFSNSISAGILAGLFAMLYFFMTMLSPILPPAMLFSVVIGYFVYKLRDNGSEGVPLMQASGNNELPKPSKTQSKNEKHKVQMRSPKLLGN